MAALLIIGLSAIVLGGVFVVIDRAFAGGLVLQAVGCGFIAVAGFWVLGVGATLGASFSSNFDPRFGVDGLSATFIGMLGLIAAPALIFSLNYLQPTAKSKVTTSLIAAFLLALVVVICARDPISFLAGWELMTLLPAAIILVARGDDQPARQTVFVYVAITHLGGAGTWIAILLLAKAGAIGQASVINTGSGLQIAIALTALLGMGTKAGVIPLHIWLPRAHPIAPAPVSALMSGVMIKVAIYALIRVLVEWVGVLPLWFAVLILAVGALSGVGGVVYALFQHDLKRLLALHSIENIGIIILGIGASLILRANGVNNWAAFALAAALLHTLNHAVFKALLFLCAGVIEKTVGSLELDRLGGLLKRMPWTGSAFLVGAMAISGLPPLNGFASEWLTLQALLHISFYNHLAVGICGAIALAALASTAALAVFCFVKVVGLVLLGPPRNEGITDLKERTRLPMRTSMVFLAALCVVLGIIPGLLFSVFVGLAPSSANAPLHIGLQLPGTGNLPTIGIFTVLFILTVSLFLLRGKRTSELSPSWACGQLVQRQLNWTSAGFTKPLRLVLEIILRPKREITVRKKRGVVQEITYSGYVPHLIDERVYQPSIRLFLAMASHVRKLQSGSLATYVAYLVGLIIILLAAARIGVLQ